MPEFASDDYWRLYTDRLIKAEVIAPVGYGKGLPVFLPWGMMIVRRLVELFKEEFSRGYRVEPHVPSTLVEAESYDLEVEDFGGYDNIYRLILDGREFVVRPDAAVVNLSRAVKSQQGRGDSTTLSVFQGFRRIKGATPPLFRDRCIWPFVQLNRVVSAGRSQQAVEDIINALKRFFARLGLPVEIIRVGPWKNYARDLYDVVLIMPDGTPTILAMFFVVGESYRRAAGIPDDYEAFDVGLTEKNISALLLSRPDEDGILLSSHLSPVQVVIGSETGTWPSSLPPEKVSFQCVPRSKKNWWKVWQHRGVPLLFDDDGQRVRFKSRLGDWSDYEPGTTVSELLALHDEQMMSCYSKGNDEARAKENFLPCCPECLPADRLTGEVVPTQVGLCHQCSSPAPLQFVPSSSQVY
jgi:prolyl-tRNA synthetase